MKWLLRLLVFVGALVALLRLLGFDTLFGGLVINHGDLESLRDRGYRRSRLIVGGCVVGDDVDPELFVRLMPAMVVVGGFVGPVALGDAYGDRLKVIGGVTMRKGKSLGAG